MHYFDHNASTPIAPEVLEAYQLALREHFGNASSVHQAGQTAKQKLEASRQTVAATLHASPREVVFTSGGTESNNLALLGFVRGLPAGPKHIITTRIEHPAVLEPCRQLAREGVAVSYVEPDLNGIVQPQNVAYHVQPETVLISVMHANNEVGTIQPVGEIAEIAHRNNAIFHCDGVQALGKIAVDAGQLQADLYAVSAHKIYAPKGVGALYVRKGMALRSILFGGRHERDRRAGTENVPGIMAFARAAEMLPATWELEALRDRFESAVLSAIDDVEVNGGFAPRLPNTSNLLFRGVSGESMVISLDMKGMAVSSGSACSSGSVEPSHVLLAMGRTVEEARSCVRFSFGRYNTAVEIDALAEAVIGSVRRLRRGVKTEANLVRV